MKTNQSILEIKDQIKSLINQTRQESIKDLNESKNLMNEIKMETNTKLEIKNKTIEETFQSKL